MSPVTTGFHAQKQVISNHHLIHGIKVKISHVIMSETGQRIISWGASNEESITLCYAVILFHHIYLFIHLFFQACKWKLTNLDHLSRTVGSLKQAFYWGSNDSTVHQNALIFFHYDTHWYDRPSVSHFIWNNEQRYSWKWQIKTHFFFLIRLLEILLYNCKIPFWFNHWQL